MELYKLIVLSNSLLQHASFFQVILCSFLLSWETFQTAPRQWDPHSETLLGRGRLEGAGEMWIQHFDTIQNQDARIAATRNLSLP